MVEENGYLYVWLSNESENTEVWFDDLKVTHTATFVAQATDYGAWGDVLREQRTDERKYRYGYQGQFAERDEETGWNHFELREYDAVIGRWLVVDPAKEFPSPYVGMGNKGVNAVDPDGACTTCPWPVYIGELLVRGFTKLFGGGAQMLSENLQGQAALSYQQTANRGELYDQRLSEDWTGPSAGSLENEFELAQTVLNVQSVASIAQLGADGANMYLTFTGASFSQAVPMATADGFLYGSIAFRTPFNIPVQRFGSMSIGASERAFGLRLGPSRFLARTGNAIRPEWNSLSVYTTGVIPRGTRISIGLTAPQGGIHIGLLPQINLRPRFVVNQVSRFID